MVHLQNFCDFRIFVFEYRAQNENPEITENLNFLTFYSKTLSNPYLFMLFHFFTGRCCYYFI